MGKPEIADGSAGALGRLTGWPAIILTVAVLALAFQGSRGIWDPDEGFYSNVAVGMVRSGDWLVPHLNGRPFLDKPPLHYWGMALGMELFGINEWGARLFQAIWFIGAALLAGALGARLYDAPTGRLAALIYATTLVPFFAANILTCDTPLAFFALLVVLCYWRAQENAAGGRAWLWWLALGGAAGLGILAKGPAMLVFLLPIVVHFLVRRGPKRALVNPWAYAAVALALVIGGSWYLFVCARLEGAGAYFLDNQAVGRLVTTTYRRNAGLAGGFKVYLPALTVGALPWSALWPLLWLRLRGKGGGPFLRGLPGRPAALLLALWIAIPVVVLFVASSRLVLYSLPLFAPIAIATARGALVAFAPAGRSPKRWLLPACAALWCTLLIAGKGVASAWPDEHDARTIARGIEARLPSKEIDLVSVNDKRNGLPFYGYHRFEWVTIDRDDYPFFTPVGVVGDLMLAQQQTRSPRVYLVPAQSLKRMKSLMRRSRFACRDLGEFSGYGLLTCGPPGQAE